MIEVSGELHFLVAGGGDFREGALEVGFHGVANGVELDADTVDFVRGVRGPGWPGGGCKRCCDRGADKGASVHGPHSTISRRKGNGDLCERGIQRYFLTEGGVVRVSPFPSSTTRKPSLSRSPKATPRLARGVISAAPLSEATSAKVPSC